MNTSKAFLFFFLLLILCLPGRAQTFVYTVQNAHSHNDYEKTLPFFTAYSAGFGSIEADVFPVDGKLFVAHDKTSINPERSLKSLYLDPLLQKLSADKSRRLILLIDIKEDYQVSLPILIRELSPLRSIMSSGQLQIVISGNRPTPAEFNNYPSYIHFDDDQTRKSSPEQWSRIGLVSLRFSNFSKWKGEGKIVDEEMLRIKSTVDSVHSAGKKIRFWGAPDNPESWKMLMKLKVDLIGTDKINQLASFLKPD